MQIRILNRAELHQTLPMTAAIAAMRDAFIALVEGRVVAPLRQAMQSPESNGTTLLMGAAVAGIGTASKTVAVFPDNPRRGLPLINGVLLYLDPDTGAPLGICDSGPFTAIRTAAVAGAVTDILARPDARIAAVIGAGAQARTQVIALDTVRELETIRVFAPHSDKLAAFVAELEPQVRASLEPAASANAAVAGADIVTAATSSSAPVFPGAALATGCHVNGVGSFTLKMRELDRDTIAGSRVYVDDLDSALAEAGELVDAETAGLTQRAEWTEIGKLFLDPDGLRPAPGTRTLFKSVGYPVQDVAAARVAFTNAERLGLGQLIEL